MFWIHISEKNGPERTERFDRPEIRVGRVHGNDLMLAKGNVSKHHARLLYRDGRYVISDLESTNGTYVNGRKISQATIVREGELIHIGDFVLRLEAPSVSPTSREVTKKSRSFDTIAPSPPPPPSAHGWLGGNYPEAGPALRPFVPADLPPPSSQLADRPRVSARPTEPPPLREGPKEGGREQLMALLYHRVEERLSPSFSRRAAIDEGAFSGHLSQLIAEAMIEIRGAWRLGSLDESALARDVHRELLALGVLRAAPRLEELVRARMLTGQMASFLSRSMAAGANLLVVGERGPTLAIVSALVHADDSRLVSLHSASEQGGADSNEAIALSSANSGAEAAERVRAAASLRPGRLAMMPFAGEAGLATLDIIAEGAEGVLAMVEAPSLGKGLERVALSLAASRSGLAKELVRDWIGASFDLVVEAASLADGSKRVLRIGELRAREGGLEVDDIFVFSKAEAGSSFSATGFVPAIVEESAARGENVDLELFRAGRSS